MHCDIVKGYSKRYKEVGFAVQNNRDCGAKTTCLEFLATSKRPFGYKQKTFRLQAKDRSLISKSLC